MAKKSSRIALYRYIWCKIRFWQHLKDVSDSELAAYLQRTLRDYDKNARTVTLENLDNFSVSNNIELSKLLTM